MMNKDGSGLVMALVRSFWRRFMLHSLLQIAEELLVKLVH